MQKAVGYVLREVGHVYPDEIRQFIVQNMADLSLAFSRAIERRNPDLRAKLRQLRKEARA